MLKEILKSVISKYQKPKKVEVINKKELVELLIRIVSLKKTENLNKRANNKLIIINFIKIKVEQKGINV